MWFFTYPNSCNKISMFPDWKLQKLTLCIGSKSSLKTNRTTIGFRVISSKIGGTFLCLCVGTSKLLRPQNSGQLFWEPSIHFKRTHWLPKIRVIPLFPFLLSISITVSWFHGIQIRKKFKYPEKARKIVTRLNWKQSSLALKLLSNV